MMNIRPQLAQIFLFSSLDLAFSFLDVAFHSLDQVEEKLGTKSHFGSARGLATTGLPLLETKRDCMAFQK
jgi:hypothetical protein